jgi:energy-coupling factor transporter transmembrane protein EcfT
MAATFIWSRAISALKKQLGTLGSEFIGEMLQRPDIDNSSDIVSIVTPSEAIMLAEDLGMISSTDALRLRQAHETINHFAEYEEESEEDEQEGMSRDEAMICLRACVNSILGQPKLEVAQDFAAFRRDLEERTFKNDDSEISGLLNAPYFFLKTTLSILLALLRTATGAQLEHVVRNTRLILPLTWTKHRKPEKWQAGQTYAEIYAEGKKDAVNGLKSALAEVSGFDYVPENLRSSTFTRAARDVLEAHQGVNNYYNEPDPMRALAALGTTIPSPAFPVCMTATLSVWLGNAYGHSWGAQESARKVLRGLSRDRWAYYLDDVLPRDSDILVKLNYSQPAARWAELIREFDVDPSIVNQPVVRRLVRSGAERNIEKIEETAKRIIDLSRK